MNNALEQVNTQFSYTFTFTVKLVDLLSVYDLSLGAVVTNAIGLWLFILPHFQNDGIPLSNKHVTNSSVYIRFPVRYSVLFPKSLELWLWWKTQMFWHCRHFHAWFRRDLFWRLRFLNKNSYLSLGFSLQFACPYTERRKEKAV